MAHFQVRYNFDSNTPTASGEFVLETVEAGSAHEVAQRVQDALKHPSYVIEYEDGSNKLVVLQTAAVRFVEICPCDGTTQQVG